MTQVADIWTGAASANWNTTAVNWGGAALANSPAAGAYNNGDRVLFDDTVGAGFTSLTVAIPVGPLAVSFNNNAKNYTLSSSGANLIADKAGTQTPLSKGGTGTITLTGPNTYSGGTILLAGQLNINSSSSSANSAIGTGVLTISGGKLDHTSSSDVTLLPNNAQNWNGDFTYAGSVHNLNLGTGAVSLSGSRNVTVSGNTLTIGGIISGASFGLTKLGGGMLTLSGANTYSGPTTISAGTLSIPSIADGGSSSPLGASANTAANLVFGGGTLNYTGANASSDRSFTINAATTATINAANNLTLTGTSPTTTGYLKNTGAGILTLDPGAGNSYSVGCLSGMSWVLEMRLSTPPSQPGR